MKRGNRNVERRESIISVMSGHVSQGRGREWEEASGLRRWEEEEGVEGRRRKRDNASRNLL